MKKILSKKIPLILASGTLALSTLVGVGVVLGNTIEQKTTPSTITFNFGSESVSYSEDEFEVYLNGVIDSENEVRALITEPDENWDVQQTAEIMELAFMNLSLTGFYDPLTGASPDNPIPTTDVPVTTDQYSATSILGNVNSANGDWNLPNQFDYVEIFNTLVEIKLFIDSSPTTSTGQTITYFYEYANNLSKTDPELAKVIQGVFDDISFETYWDARDGSTDAEWNALIEQLGLQVSWQKEITKFIYSYAWLWQDSIFGSFDYNITQYLATQKPSFVWQLSINEVDWLDNADTNMINAWKNTGIVPTEWNDLINNNPNINSSRASLQSGADIIGFEGIKFGASDSISNVYSTFWNYDNVYTPIDSSAGGGVEATDEWINTTTDPFTPNLYVHPLNSEDDNVILQPVGSDTATTANVVAVNHLYPYVFPEDYTNGTSNKYSYGIEAYKVTNGSTVTYYDNAESGGDLINFFDEIGVGIDSGIPYVELYVTYALYNSISSEIQNNSYIYWKNNGFSIELTGAYETSYSGYIDTRLQT